MYGTQRRFAQIIGKNEFWLSRVIHGKHDLSEAERKLIISRLGLDYDVTDFFLGQEE